MSVVALLGAVFGTSQLFSSLLEELNCSAASLADGCVPYAQTSVATDPSSIDSIEDLCCPVCQDVYRDPVVLFCSHSFCRLCLKSWWEGKKKLECPLCKEESTTSDPPCNLALKMLCDRFLLTRKKEVTKPEVICRPHGERFKLFCVDDEKLLCLVCQHSDGHYGHKLQPVNEVAQGRRNELRKALRPLLDKLKVFKEEKGNLDQTAEYIKLQGH
uniref:Uncharacterized protein n=1 Tax=Poecilia mexicana TaxID=48701 RepID=A0A3B3X991_9TELE